MYFTIVIIIKDKTHRPLFLGKFGRKVTEGSMKTGSDEVSRERDHQHLHFWKGECFQQKNNKTYNQTILILSPWEKIVQKKKKLELV